MNQLQTFSAKLLYALLFLVFIPAGLWAWAFYTETTIVIPGILSKPVGIGLCSLGMALMLWAMYMLKAVGKGLPMNAFPPANFVTTGPYHVFRHPIYVGFGLMMVGISLYTGSASGLWLVTPLTVLAMIALVLGYESIDLQERFPGQKIKTILDFPKKIKAEVFMSDRLAAIVWMLGLIMLSNFLLAWIHAKAPATVKSFTPTPWLSYFYIFGLIWIVAIPFTLRTQNALRQWLISGVLALSFMIFAMLFYPVITGSLWISVPHTLLAVPGAIVLLSIETLLNQKRKLQGWFTLPLIALLLAQIFASATPVYYCLWSILLYLPASKYRQSWLWMKNGAEKIANSWKEWNFGNVRIINHGFYVGGGAFFGIIFGGVLGGPDYALVILIFAVVVTICSALWAQLVEGSDKLKRPFGYYGGLVGILFGSGIVWVMGYNAWVVIGIFSVAMPWVQAIGRLRCLVNGCCHGKKTDNPLLGIRYFHPRSRVCNLSGAKGELLHPTQLYSILWLIIVGMVQFSLWQNHYSYTFIFGLYLILTSIGRFAEEAYRGEVQTVVIKGLRLYQWTALIALSVGIAMTLIQVPEVTLHPSFSLKIVGMALAGAVFLTFSMGIDFPYSNARFSRLV